MSAIEKDRFNNGVPRLDRYGIESADIANLYGIKLPFGLTKDEAIKLEDELRALEIFSYVGPFISPYGDVPDTSGKKIEAKAKRKSLFHIQSSRVIIDFSDESVLIHYGYHNLENSFVILDTVLLRTILAKKLERHLQIRYGKTLEKSKAILEKIAPLSKNDSSSD